MRFHTFGVFVFVFAILTCSARNASAQNAAYVVSMTAPVPNASGNATVTANTQFNLTGDCNWPWYLGDIDTIQVIIVDMTTGLTEFAQSQSVPNWTRVVL